MAETLYAMRGPWSLIRELDPISVFMCLCSVVSDSLRPHGLQPARLLRPWDFPGKSTGVGCHALPQGSFPTQGRGPPSPALQQPLYHCTLGRPRAHTPQPKILHTMTKAEGSQIICF